MVNILHKDDDIVVSQRPLSLPSTLVDFLVTEASGGNQTPNAWLVEILSRGISEYVNKPFDLDAFNKSVLAHDPPIKFLARLPVELDEKLQQMADQSQKTPNLLIFQSILNEFEKSSRQKCCSK